MVKKSNYITVPFERIVCDRTFNPREEYKGIEELAKSISEVGLLQPIGVSPKKGPGDTEYFLAYGFRRYAALVLIREQQGVDAFHEVPVVINDVSTDELRFANFIENIDREALTDTEIGKTIKVLTNCGFKQAEIAERIGKPQSWVSTHYKLATKLTKKAQDALDDGSLNVEQALNVAELPEDQQNALVEQVSDADTRSEARKLIKEGTKETRKRKQYKGRARPTAKNIKQHVSDASFDAESPNTSAENQAFYNGIAAGLRVALGDVEYDTIKAGGTYTDVNYHSDKGDSSDATEEAEATDAEEKPKKKQTKKKKTKKSEVSESNTV